MGIAFDPALAIIAAVRAANPSFPAGSWAEPTVNSSLTSSWGSTDFWSTNRTLLVVVDAACGAAARGGGPTAAANAVAGLRVPTSGARSISFGSGFFATVVTISPTSVKYF